MADTFAVADDARTDRYDTAAAAMVAVSADVRAQIAKKLANGVPARFRSLFRASWWDQAVDRNAAPAFAGIADDTIDDFAGGLDLNLDLDQRADVGGRTVGTVLGLLGARFDTVRSRIRDLHAQALKEGWDPDRFADELGLDGESPGVLSDDASANIGRSLATLLIEAAGVYILTRSERSATKTWRTVGDDRVRSAHAEADGQTVGIDETFDVGGEEALFPGDPSLSPDNAIGCRCALEYLVEGVDTADMTPNQEEEAMAVSAGPRPDILPSSGASGGRAPLASHVGTGRFIPVPEPTSLDAEVKAFAVDGARITVTVEPTATEKQLLAGFADVPAQLHVPLLDVGDVASFTPDARTALAGALSTVAANTPPLSGAITGTGYLETDGVTVGIVDCPGLGALRDQIAAALADMVPEPGEFIPTVVLTAGSVDVSQIAGTPVHFNELRVHVGDTETLVFDLLGPLPVAPSPDTAPPTTETPPAAPADAPPAETSPPEALAMTTTDTYATGVDVTLPAGWRLVPSTSTTGTAIQFTPADPPMMPDDPAMPDNAPPAPALSDVADEDLEAEIARRAATQAAADTGANPDDLIAEALAEVSGIVAEVVAELETPEDSTAPPATPPPPPAPGAAADGHEALAAGGESGLPLADRDTSWDASAADGRVSKMASSDGTGDPDTIDWAAYGRAFFWHAPNPSAKGDFKLPFADMIGGQLQAVPKGIFACAGVLQGGRGGVDIPAADKDTIKGKISAYYAACRKKFDDDSITPPWDTTVDSPSTLADGLLAPDVNGDGIGEIEATDYEWEGILAIEGTPTSDGRMFAEGALTWRTLPLTLALQTVTAPGHDGAVVCGSICEIERVGNTIIGRGRFSGTDAGELARTLIGEGSLHGVSIDVASAVVVYTDENGNEVDGLEVALFGDPAVAVFVQAEMMAATLTPFPAFADARVDLIDVPTSLVATSAPGQWRLSGPALFTLNTDTEALVASAAPTIPAPPASLFALKPDTREPFSVRAPLPDGTIPVYGLLADWNIPHIGHDGRKVYPPRGDDFAMFYTGKFVRTREGDRIPTGPIFIDTVHPNLAAQASDAQAFYAHTGSAVADVHLYNGEHGIVAAGVLRRDVDELTRCRMEGSDVSPDWRPVNGQYRMIAILAVNASGFPVPYIEGIAASAGRLRSWVAYDDTTGAPLAMVAVGAVHRERKPSEVVADLQATVAGQATHLAELESKIQLLTGAVFATTEPATPDVAVPVAADDDDGPVELSADERAVRARAAMAALGLDRESRRRRALTAMGITD